MKKAAKIPKRLLKAQAWLKSTKDKKLIAYKKVHAEVPGQPGRFAPAIATLEIPANAARIMGTYDQAAWGVFDEVDFNNHLKFRVSRAKVLKLEWAYTDIRAWNGNYPVETVVVLGGAPASARSSHNMGFVYYLGEVVKPTKPFDKRDIACASGIHCFRTLRQARNY